MKCPACYNELTPLQVGSLTVDVCQSGCGGIWFDAFELQRVDQEEEAAGQPLLELKREPGVLVDPARKRECPRCPGIKLHRHFFSARRRVDVDECPNCGGYWLDAGELAAIRAEKSAAHNNERLREATLSSETIRYLYSLKIQARKQSGPGDPLRPDTSQD
jgi:Zn-finger nucleic acid-binding protein